MKVSAQEEYGLRCLLAIANKGAGATMTIPELSEAEGMSQPYVGKLMSILRKGGYVTSTRGQIGGYSLATPASEIKLSEVLSELGGRLFSEDFCERHPGIQEQCSHLHDCALNGLWAKVQAVVDEVLSQSTLQDLVERKFDIFSTVDRESTIPVMQ